MRLIINKILDVKYDVIEVSNLDKDSSDNEYDICGVCDYKNKIIFIQRHLSPTMERRILKQMFAEAIMKEYGLCDTTSGIYDLEQVTNIIAIYGNEIESLVKEYYRIKEME